MSHRFPDLFVRLFVCCLMPCGQMVAQERELAPHELPSAAKAGTGFTASEAPPERSSANAPGGVPAQAKARQIGQPGSVALQKYDKLPLSFERAGDGEFLARGQGLKLDVRGARVTIALSHAKTVGMEFVGGSDGVAVAEKELPGKVNYVIGNDPKRWRLGLETYERVRYREVYPGVDVVYYGNQKQLEFDLALQPKADVRAIKMRFSGGEKLSLDPSGSLVLGDLRLMAPKVFQGEKSVPAQYELLDNDEIAFEVGGYDRSQPLIIDPTIVYSTLLGGGNGFSYGDAIALDASGNVYVAGLTYADDFPVASPAFAGYNANADGFVSKTNAAGTALIYSTYIGGSSYDYFQGIAVDSTGAAWVVGKTESSDFPLLTPYQSSYGGGTDAVVVKLSPTGALAYSTFVGGPNFDSASAVAVDPNGNAYVAGDAEAGFPTTAGVYEAVIQGSDAAFVTKFSSNGTLVWSTFVGGKYGDYANGIAVDEFGNSYIAGVAYSTSFPNAPPGGAQQVNRGNGDAFVAKLNFNGSGLLYFTFLGGSQYDAANAIAVDPVNGVAVVGGVTDSPDLSTSAGALQPRTAGGCNGFVAKLNAAGSAFIYTTYLGGNRCDSVQSVAIDSSDNAYVAGYTDSNTFPVSSAVQTGLQGNSTSLFHSSDTGAIWAPFDANIPGAAYSISPDPAVAGTIVVATESGVYRTTNGGGTWTQESTAYMNSLSRSHANAAVIYGTDGTDVFESIDAGVTWSLNGSLPYFASGIVADPLSASTAYAFTSYESGTPLIQKTTNNGVSWSTAVTGLPTNPSVEAIQTMVAASDGSLYVGVAYGSPGGIYKSTNQAGSWALLSAGLYTNFEFGSLAVAPSNPSILYAADLDFLYESTNAGATWSSVGLLPSVGCTPNALAVSSINPAVLYFSNCVYGFSTGTALLSVSSNSGQSWTAASGLGIATIYQISTNPLNAGGAYAFSYVNSAPFVAKINSTGGNLLYSTYLGDAGQGYGVATNGDGTAVVTGYTDSEAFPVTPTALQGNSQYSQLNSFITRISDSTSSCSFTVGPQQYLTILAGPENASLEYSVVGPSGCAWTASSNQPWAVIASGSSGAGTGVVYVTLILNTTSATRTATMTIAGQAITIDQLPDTCYPEFAVGSSTVPGVGGTLTLGVTAGAGCGWNVLNNDPNAITVLSGASGTSNGTVTIRVAPNYGPNTRTFYFDILQGGSETISQAGTTRPAVVSTITSSPSGASIQVSGTGCIQGYYQTPANLTWNANTNCTIEFTTPQSIAGSSYTFYSATVNGGVSTTANPLTVNSGTSPPTINANFLAPCTYSLSSSGQSFSASGGLGSFTVDTASQCTWSPVPSASWITILPSGSKGTANVNYAVAANTSQTARSASISAGGQQFSISEAGFTCTYAINPASASVTDFGGSAQTIVSAPAGCPWTATSTVSWLTVTSGSSGTGSGAVVIAAASNSGAVRSGTVTVAGQTFTMTQGAGACGAIDVSAQTKVYAGPFILFSVGFETSLYSEQVSITNTSSGAIQGPVYLVTVGMPTHQFPDDPTFANSGLSNTPPGTATTTCFTAAGDYLIPFVAGNLAAGQNVTFDLNWIGGPAGLGYTTKILSGTPSH